jgi:hypothetical protein
MHEGNDKYIQNLVKKSEKKKSPGTARCRWDDIKTYLRKTGCETVECLNWL